MSPMTSPGHGETDVIKRDHARIDLADVDELKGTGHAQGTPEEPARAVKQ